MINVVCMTGRICTDLETKKTPSGTSVCSFRLAVQRSGRAKDENGETISDFFNVVAWSKTAEFLPQYFAKGDAIGIVGRLQARAYEDKNGDKRTVTEIVADGVHFIESKRSADAPAAKAPAKPAAAAPSNYIPAAYLADVSGDDDLPF